MYEIAFALLRSRRNPGLSIWKDPSLPELLGSLHLEQSPPTDLMGAYLYLDAYQEQVG